jgi:hypothetical protein
MVFRYRFAFSVLNALISTDGLLLNYTQVTGEVRARIKMSTRSFWLLLSVDFVVMRA